MKPYREPYEGTQAVRRAISLLKSFTEDHPEQNLTQLADRLKLNKTTVYRLLTALESEGLVTRDPESDSYLLGSELIVLAGIVMRSNHLRKISRPELRKLANHTGETTSLEVLSGHDVLIIEEIVGEHLMTGSQSIGTRWPAFATSTGKAIMAYLPEAQIAEILANPLPEITPRTITDPRLLRRELAAIRKRGYAIAQDALEPGFTAVGAAILDRNDEVVAAISIGGPGIRLSPARIAKVGPVVHNAALQISFQLGYRIEVGKSS